jgi:3-oxoacyl-(acyl-carrier-protein) synthase
MDDVLITGMGVICCLGNGAEAFWRGMADARSAPTVAMDPHAHMELPLMYSVPAADVPDKPRQQAGLQLGQASRYALTAAAEAVADAALGDVNPSRLSVVIGTGMGDSGLHEQWRADGFGVDDRWVPVFSPASVISGWLGAAGANTSISNACAASGFGLSVAADLIRMDEADVVIAGGVEAYSRVALACFNRLGAVDSQRCRPFDRNRRGTVFGEGAAVLVLESVRHARARNAPRRYARLAGTGWSCDAYHSTAPEPTGKQIMRAMHSALDEAGTGPDQVGCVVPHGTGTELNDLVESHAINEVLGDLNTPLYSLKGLIGHTGGAAGALAVLAGVLMLWHRTVPPNVALDELDPECKVTLPDAQKPLDGSCVLVNAYAFGGNNVSLALLEVSA